MPDDFGEYDEEMEERSLRNRGMRACEFCGEAFCYCSMPPCQNCEILTARAQRLTKAMREVYSILRSHESHKNPFLRCQAIIAIIKEALE